MLQTHYNIIERHFYFMEVWKDIIGYEGFYQISNLGNVKSLDRAVSYRGGLKLLKGVELKKTINLGYSQVGLYKDGKRKIKMIHVALAESFLNHKPDGLKLVVNHINHIRHDNRLENLELISQRENTNKKHIPSTSKYVGVHFRKDLNRFASCINIKGKRKHLGHFKNEIDAHNAYQKELLYIKTI